MRRAVPVVLLSIALAATAAGCGGAKPSSRSFDFAKERKATNTYVVGAGDVLQVSTWKNEALTRRVTVRPDGLVTMPLVGDVLAGGRTSEQIARDIVQRAQAFYSEA